MTLTIHPATPSDLPELSRMAADLMRFHHALDQERFFLPRAPERGYQSFLRSELSDPDAVLLCAHLGTPPQLVGYAFGRMEDVHWEMLLDACGHFHDLYVLDSARGHGVGEALTRAMLDALKAKGAVRVVLYTASGNTGAHKLFAKAGFRTTMLEMTCELGETD